MSWPWTFILGDINAVNLHGSNHFGTTVLQVPLKEKELWPKTFSMLLLWKETDFLIPSWRPVFQDHEKAGYLFQSTWTSKKTCFQWPSTVYLLLPASCKTGHNIDSFAKIDKKISMWVIPCCFTLSFAAVMATFLWILIEIKQGMWHGTCAEHHSRHLLIVAPYCHPLPAGPHFPPSDFSLRD